ncbi:MAG TPA: Ig-like domain-containing protein, partial [Solirubrobacteraceae bacterium]|nr:Ig-like domain-containing protein [Solirubrobacteraceae bacterium]
RAAARRPARRVAKPRRLAVVGPPDQIGAWDGPPRVITRSGGPTESMPAIHAVTLPTGKVLMFGPPLGVNRPRNPRANESVAVLFDPATRTFEDVPPPIDPRTGLRANIYCGGASLMADGRVLVTGGYLDFDETRPNYVNNRGLNHTWVFDPWAKAWTRTENLGGGNDTSSIAGGRWYPSQLLMPDGRSAIFGGITETGTALNYNVEVYDPRKPGGDALDTLSGRVTGVGAGGTDEFFYSHVFWMPSGRGYVVGPARWNSFFFGLPAPLNFTQTDAPEPRLERSYGTGVLLPLNRDSTAGRVLLAGGMSHPNRDDNPANDVPGAHNYYRLPATNTTESFGEGAASWTADAPLNRPRAHLNTVLLPDGRLVTVGGGAGGNNLYAFDPARAERQVELFDGTRWILGPEQAETRAYHSVAVLLPDGSVISAGDDNPNATDANPQLDTYEIYKPPYFFRGTRPAITSAPQTGSYGGTIRVAATSATPIARAVLVAPGAATHAVDMSQRLVATTATTVGPNAYDIRMPANTNVAPPGHYMLFVVDDQGRPSAASWLAIGTPARPTDGTGGGTVDTTPPSVAGRVPAPGATGVAVGTNVAAAFSEAVQGVDGSSFTLRNTSTGALVTATVTRTGTTNEWVLDPGANLAAGTSYTASLTAAIRDAAGNALAPVSWSFTTATAPTGDTTAPTVTARAPGPGFIDVHPGTNVAITFSEAVQNVTTGTLTLRPVSASGALGAPVAAAVTRNGTTNQWLLDPAGTLPTDTRFRVTITGGSTGIRDLANNPLASSTYDFLTGPRPSITARSPGVNATGFNRTANITMTFSEPVLNVNATNIVLRATAGGAQIAATVSYNATTRVATLNPSPTLAANTQYTVSFIGNTTSGIRDAAGNALNPALAAWSFRTAG